MTQLLKTTNHFIHRPNPSIKYKKHIFYFLEFKNTNDPNSLSKTGTAFIHKNKKIEKTD